MGRVVELVSLGNLEIEPPRGLEFDSRWEKNSDFGRLGREGMTGRCGNLGTVGGKRWPDRAW